MSDGIRVFDAYCVSCYLADRVLMSGAGEGTRTPDLLITNQLLYRPELRQPKQKWNYSTSYATRTIPVVSTIGLDCEAPLTDRLEQRNPGRDRHIQALNVPPHRYRRQPVAMVPHETTKTRALGAQDQRSWHC